MRSLLMQCILLAVSAVPTTAADAQTKVDKGPIREYGRTYSAEKTQQWEHVKVDKKDCVVSPTLKVKGYELNHHRISVDYSGKGKVYVSVAHNKKDDFKSALGNKKRHSPLKKIASGKSLHIASRYSDEKHAWIILHIEGDVKINSVKYRCFGGKNAIYGHKPMTFKFAGAKLPYRIMYPRKYDPQKKYPLVLSVSGSGGVGTDNYKSMENVILGRYLYTTYYLDKEFECFSVVPQIPPLKKVPKPYYPADRDGKGKPTPTIHPDWPAVNEEGWYVQASLALIQSLIEDKNLSIDADRVYYGGFSYGGKACWEFLKAGPDVFAGAICGAGWPIGGVGTDPKGQLAEALKQEVARYKHIPVTIFVGSNDRGMLPGSKAVHKEIQAQGGKSVYVEFPKTGHVGSAGKFWPDRKRIKWLFQQNRSKNPKAASLK